MCTVKHIWHILENSTNDFFLKQKNLFFIVFFCIFLFLTFFNGHDHELCTYSFEYYPVVCYTVFVTKPKFCLHFEMI